MGTSMSSPGSSNASPLVPAWAAPDGKEIPAPAGHRFRAFRTELGRAVGGSGGRREGLERALGHYARGALGGSRIGTLRFNPVTTAGSALYSALRGVAEGGEGAVGGLLLSTLVGMPVEAAIDVLVRAFTPANGDGERIRTALRSALAQALQNTETFDPGAVTADVMVEAVTEYLAVSIFLHIVSESADAFTQIEDPVEVVQAEDELLQLVRSTVEVLGRPLLSGDDAEPMTMEAAKALQDRVVEQVLSDWEADK